MIENKKSILSLPAAIGTGEIIFKSKKANNSELYISIIIILSLAVIYFIISRIYEKRQHHAEHKKSKGTLTSFNTFNIKSGFSLKLYLTGIGYFTGLVIDNNKGGIIVRLPHWHAKKN